VTTATLLALGLLFSVASMISYITQEKELRQKELMKMMSVTEFEIELSWYITFMVFNVITSCFCTLVSSFLFTYSSPLLLWFFWLMTFTSLTFYSTAIAAFCSKATRGVLVGLLFFFSGLFLSLIFNINTMSSVVITIAMLHPIASFSWGINLLGLLDDNGIGLTSDTISYVGYKTGYSMRIVFVGYTYSCIFWLFVTWYLNRTVTPEYGQAAEVWYFPLTYRYWRSFFPRRSIQHVSTKDGETSTTVTGLSSQSEDGITTNDVLQQPPPTEEVSEILQKQSKNGECIEIMNLHKSFGTKQAVNGLDLTMYNGHITALLGHNGTYDFSVSLFSMF
jgi:ABC-2 family transporter protein